MPSRSDAVTCSPACRQKAYRQRQSSPTRAAPKRPTKPDRTKKTRSGKGTRGGAGRKQGRKKVLTFDQMFVFGEACERLWQRLMERKAKTEYRNQPHVGDIHQERAALSGALPRDVSLSAELHVSADGLVSWSERPLFRRVCARAMCIATEKRRRVTCVTTRHCAWQNELAGGNSCEQRSTGLARS